MTIFLTSNSNRRKTLLQQLGFRPQQDFRAAEIQVASPHNRKTTMTLAEARERVVEVAQLKVRQALSGDYLANQGLSAQEIVVIGVHTFRFFEGQILDQPLPVELQRASLTQIQGAELRARQMLEALCGREFLVLGGLAVALGDDPAKKLTAWSATRVTMKVYSQRDIEAYIASGEGLMMAGALDLAGRGVILHQKIKGGFSNIDGLPLMELASLLRDPLFEGRVPFRLTEADQSRFSLPVRQGQIQNKIVSLATAPQDADLGWPEIEGAQVLHVPGSILLTAGEHENLLAYLARVKEAGKLIVLDDGPAVIETLGKEAFRQLLRHRVDVVAPFPLSAGQLSRFMAPRLLLASQSPRRYELLKQIVAPNQIEVLASQQEEHYLDEAPQERVERLALEKARAVAAQRGSYSHSIEIVIGADTEVVLDGQALGKPTGPSEARRQLHSLQGRCHQVITGIALICTHNDKEIVDCVKTWVKFKELTDQEIETYITSGEPFGKAGSYGIQSKGALLVAEIDGSYSNVVGLPLERLAEILDREFGLPVWQLDAVSGWRLPGQE